MTDIPKDALTPPLVENPHAPDVFADRVSGWFLAGGNIRLTFESSRASHITNPATLSRVVIGRLVMPLDAAEDMAKGVLEFIAQQRALLAAGAQAPISGTVN